MGRYVKPYVLCVRFVYRKICETVCVVCEEVKEDCVSKDV